MDGTRSSATLRLAALVGVLLALALQPEGPVQAFGRIAADAPARLQSTPSDAVEWRWRRARGPSSEGGVRAVAVDPSTGRVAVADEHRVWLRAPNQGLRFAARVAGTNELAFDPKGGLWVAAAGGLWRLDAEGRLSRRAPGVGQGGGSAGRVRILGDRIAVATDVGVFTARLAVDAVSGPLGRWQRLSGPPLAPVTALALRPSAGDRGEPYSERFEVWLAQGARVFRVAAAEGAPGEHTALATLRSERVTIPGAPTGEPVADIALALHDSDVTLVYPRALATRSSEGRWRILRPVLPPGARALRIEALAGRLWLATDGGLLESRRLEGPWSRAGAPAGTTATRQLVSAEGGLLAATRGGLLEASPPATAQTLADRAATAGGPGRSQRADPPIGAVQRATLRHQGLSPERMRALRRGLSRRGWLPALSLDVGVADDRAAFRDFDQSFVSGQTRHLADRELRSARDLDASLSLVWRLGDLAFDPDAIDLSREDRALISLRDDVLDEVNQLYFERQAVLAALPEQGGVERERMRLRADELAAGLDAWTGGWFSAAGGRAPPAP